MKVLFAPIFVMAAAALFWLQPATAESLCLDRPIRLAFYEHGRIFDAERNTGIDRDLVTQLIEKSGCKFDLSVLARARIWIDIARGDLDMTTSGIATPEREQFAVFAPYLKMKNHFVFRNFASNFSNLEMLQKRLDLKFAVVRSFRHEPAIDAFLQSISPADRVIPVATTEMTFTLLAKGRVDVIFSQPAAYFYYAEKYGLQNQTAFKDLIPETEAIPHGMVLARKNFSQPQLESWQKLVEQMVSDGTVDNILAKHLPEEFVPVSSLRGHMEY